MGSVGSMGVSTTPMDVDSLPDVSGDATAGASDQAAKNIRTDDEGKAPAHVTLPLTDCSRDTVCKLYWTAFQIALRCSADRISYTVVQNSLRAAYSTRYMTGFVGYLVRK